MGELFGDLGCAALGDLDRPLDLVRDGLLLDGRRARPSLALVEAGDARVVGEGGGVLGEVLVEGDLELGLLQTLVAVVRC